MKEFTRLAPSNMLRVVPISRPFSNFTFAEETFRSPSFPPLRRIMTQTRLRGATTMVVETLLPAADLVEENEDIAKRIPEFTNSRVMRLSFFSKPFKTSRGLRGVVSEDFLGYAIVKEDVLSAGQRSLRIYESVVRPSRHQNNYIHGVQNWTCHVGGQPLEIAGYLYAQQNNLTNVCAHVALRTAAARFHPDGDMTYREMNQIVGIDHVKRKVGGGCGLNAKDMVAILEAAGARCFIGDFAIDPAKRPEVPFQKYLYGSIESGFPAIVCFATADATSNHAIPVFGHTFNEDTWVPNAELSYFKVGPGTKYIPSESWLNMYLIHDDNWGSNYCVPRPYLRVRHWCSQLSGKAEPCPTEAECVRVVIGTVPKKVTCDPIRAEVIGADYLFALWPQMPQTQGEWGKRLQTHAKNNKLVLRPLLISGQQYVDHLERVRDWRMNRIARRYLDVLRLGLKEMVWMIEMSVPELFQGNKRKIAEVLLWAERPADNSRTFTSFAIARLPEHFALYDGGGPKNPRFRFLPSGTTSHVELIGCEQDAMNS